MSTTAADERRDTFSNILCRLRHEFLGTPALALTPARAARLWGLDRVTAVCVLDFLASQGYVREVASGVYVRCEESDGDSCGWRDRMILELSLLEASGGD